MDNVCLVSVARPRFWVRWCSSPAAKQGEFRTNSRFSPQIDVVTAPEVAKAQAEWVMRWLGNPLYGRVDGVMRDGQFLCTEVEVTEHDLFLHLSPYVAGLLAERTLARAARS